MEGTVMLLSRALPFVVFFQVSCVASTTPSDANENIEDLETADPQVRSAAAGGASTTASGVGPSQAPSGGSRPAEVPTATDGSPMAEPTTPAETACTPDPSGLPEVLDDVTLDHRTCLMWEYQHKNDVDIADQVDENALGYGPYVGSALDVEAYCENATTGGYNDWRLPDASELHGSLVDCAVGNYYAPIDTTTRLATTDIDEETASEWNPPKLCVHNIKLATDVRGGARVRCVRGAPGPNTASPCMSCL